MFRRGLVSRKRRSRKLHDEVLSESGVDKPGQSGVGTVREELGPGGCINQLLTPTVKPHYNFTCMQVQVVDVESTHRVVS